MFDVLCLFELFTKEPKGSAGRMIAVPAPQLTTSELKRTKATGVSELYM